MIKLITLYECGYLPLLPGLPGIPGGPLASVSGRIGHEEFAL